MALDGETGKIINKKFPCLCLTLKTGHSIIWLQECSAGYDLQQVMNWRLYPLGDQYQELP